jgi:cytochrome b561
MKGSLPTRLLHLMLAAATIHQLVVSLFMQMPRPPGRTGDLAFDFHQIVGLASLGILLLFWVWTVVRRYEHGFSDLVPWFSSAQRKAVIEDLGLHLGAVRRGKFPQPAAKSALASAVHGLGLVVATGMAASGAVVYVLTEANQAVTGLGAAALDAHRVVANLMWAYLVAHASIALLHQMKGHNVLQRMFTT